MSKYSLAVKLADELGTSVSKASRFIDDVGYTKASRLVDEGATLGDDAGSLGSRLADDWWKPVVGGGAVIGGTVTGYKYLDAAKAREIANAAEAESEGAATGRDAIRLILEDDSLTPEQRRELVEQYLKSQTPPGDPDKPGLLGGDVQTLVVLLIVLALVFNYAMDGDD